MTRQAVSFLRKNDKKHCLFLIDTGGTRTDMNIQIGQTVLHHQEILEEYDFEINL